MQLFTPRLMLRHMIQNDFDSLKSILQDIRVMYAWEHSFSEKECLEWFEKQQERYKDFGYGLLGVFRGREMIGQAGITKQELDEKWVDEIGYIFKRQYWGNGYATEVANFLITLCFQLFWNKKSLCND